MGSQQNYSSSARHDGVYELLEVELAVAIRIVELDEQFAVVLTDLVAELNEDLAEVAPVDALVLVLVEEIKDFDKLLVLLCLLDPLRHQIAELEEVDLA